MHALSARCPAKVNLTLRVGPRRDDGYHEIESLVAKIGLADELSVTSRADDCFTIECSDPLIPADESNLVLRAARKLADALGRQSSGVHFNLTKNVPAGAGLGGGSSNAATALKLLCRLWQIRVPVADLAAIGAGVGSDVPLFLDAPLCVIRGRGERVEPLRAALVSAVLLVIPPIHSTTNEVYAAFDSLPQPPDREPIAEVIPRVMQANLSLPAGPGQIQGPDLTPFLFNDLQAAALSANPGLRESADRLAEATDLPFCMTGSGSAFFHLFDKYTDRRHFAALRDRIIGGCGPVRVEQTFALT